MMLLRCCFMLGLLPVFFGSSLALAETLPALSDGQAPGSLEQMWKGFDPRAEPLDVEVLKEWEDDGVVLRVVRFHIGVFKGTKARLAGIYGFPKNATASQKKLPGLVQIHGGGQYADHRAPLVNARRGYATLSIAWAGRISAPEYHVSPAEVKLFWDGKTDDPKYRLTTDWGAVDGYHAPGRNPRNHFPSANPAPWTLDRVESPRNSGWFLCALAARRALTFLEQQPEVDPERLGVYGHSMGGKLTVLTSVDPRVKAAAPSCGGISDRYNDSELFNTTLGDHVSLQEIDCPIIFLSPANDFHGRIGDLPRAIAEVSSEQWRVTCSPHHNHQDTPEFEVATMLWFDQHLQQSFQMPRSPETTLNLKTFSGIPKVTVKVDESMPVEEVNIYYTQQGKANETPSDREDTMHRYWHHARAVKNAGGDWEAGLPLGTTDKPLWVFANVRYRLPELVQGAGYYYGIYAASNFNLSSLLEMVAAEDLAKSPTVATRKPAQLIEDFKGDWEKQWFTYRPDEWARTTHKVNDDLWRAPPGARLQLKVRAEQRNKLVVLLDQHAAELQLTGGETSQTITLAPADFKSYDGKPLGSFDDVRRLKLSPAEHLRAPRGKTGPPRRIGGTWRGEPPVFQELRWLVSYSFLDMRPNREPMDYPWTRDHMHVGVRWQPFIGRPQANAYDATRPVIATDSSYAQFWVSWGAIEPTQAHTDYQNNPSPGLQAIDRAVDVCNQYGIKVEFVFFHCPRWASESGSAGGYRPKTGLFREYVRRIATHFKGRTDAFQLSHEANLQGLMQGADIAFIIDEILLQGAQAIREVYDAKPKAPVLISTTGMSPCARCTAMKGLEGHGGTAVNHFYDLMISNSQLIDSVDALNLNVSDHASGYGRIDDLIPSVWDQYELVRTKLDVAQLHSKSVLSAESWVVWDDANNAHDVNGDGKKNENDAMEKARTIIGQCLSRGLNTINLPWSDNSSSWAMGLTKRRDYNGRVGKLKPEIVVAARDAGPEIVTQKLGLRGPDDTFSIGDGGGSVFTVEDYANPADPNHLHYYVWRWYAQISSGSDEVIRHSIAGEPENDIVVTGDGFVGEERFRISSWNRTRQQFTVLIYASDADSMQPALLRIPATIQTGRHYNNDDSPIDFRGEGFADGDRYYARIISKDLNPQDGSDRGVMYHQSAPSPVASGMLCVTIPKLNRFTAVQFIKQTTDSSR